METLELNIDQLIQSDMNEMLNQLETEFQRMAGTHVLLTGGCGFLGYYLVYALKSWNKRVDDQKKIRITIFDNHIRGLPPWLDMLENDPQISLIQHDIARPFPVPEKNEDFSYIIHAASIASPLYYRKHPIETMDANVNGLRHLLEYAVVQKEKGRPVQSILFFSSSEIYGDPRAEDIPTKETYRGNVSCTGPRACYDESKRYGETLCVNFAHVYDLPIKIARPFNNYGPGLKVTDKRVIPDFAQNILNNEDMVLLSDGSPTRTFCYITDAVVGYYRLLIRGRKAEAYNIGTEKPEIPMYELAEKMSTIGRELFQYDKHVIKKESDDRDYLTDTPNQRCPSIEKAINDLEYNPRVTLDEGLRRTMIWYHRYHQGVDA